jgi:hypothetical protein
MTTGLPSTDSRAQVVGKRREIPCAPEELVQEIIKLIDRSGEGTLGKNGSRGDKQIESFFSQR